MYWTTVCDLPFVDYQPGRAVDISDWHNDAQIIGSVAAHPGHVSFYAPDGQVVIPVHDDSLQRFSGLMIDARIHPLPVNRRQNIVEGWMSFAFFVEPDGRLIASIFDGQNWIATESQPGVIPMNQWSEVSFEYDGICVGVLERDGTVVGSNLSMPLGMRQPRQNVTIGHWPNGDDRYTFTGDIGRITISRRDYEDLWRDAVDSMWCNRHLTPPQVNAIKELNQRLQSLDPETVAMLRECAAAQAQALYQLLRTLRAGNREVLSSHHRLGDLLLESWCCGADVAEAKGIVLSFLKNLAGELGTPERAAFQKMLAEIAQLGTICDWGQPPFDTLRKLFLTTVPEFELIESWANHIVSTMGQDM